MQHGALIAAFDRFLPTAVALALAVWGRSPSAAADPAAFVRAIYDGPRQISPAGGLPSGAALSLFDPELRQLLEKAAAADRDYAARHPDEKPPFAEFDPFRPLPDAHESVEVLDAAPASPPFLSSVVAVFSYKDDAVTPPARYTALLIYRLREADGAFQIRDILVVDPREDTGASSVREQLILALRTAALAD